MKKKLYLVFMILSRPLLSLRLVNWNRIKKFFNILFFSEYSIQQILRKYVIIYKSDNTILSRECIKLNSYKNYIFIFSIIDWDFRTQRPQHFARELGSQGYCVLYVNPVIISHSRSDYYLIKESLEPNVLLVHLSSRDINIPDMHRNILDKHQAYNIMVSWQKICHDFHIRAPIIIAQHPFWAPVILQAKSSKTIYDCMDHHAGFVNQTDQILINNEISLAEKVDIVTVSSDQLAEKFRNFKKASVIKNACEFTRFDSVSRIKSKCGPIIGYVGAVSNWFDDHLLFEIAREKSDWQFHIYGSTVDSDISHAESLENIKFFGEVSYNEVPQLIVNFDVCIIPFKINPLTHNTNPVKLYEYLAAGRPVVSIAMPELYGMEHVDVYCVSSHAEFIKKIEYCIYVSDISERIKIRKEFAMKNDWSNRISDLIKLINSADKIK